MIKVFCAFELLLLCLVSSKVLPVEKCKLQDSSCLLPAFQTAMPIFMSGIPEYGIDVLDTMEIDKVNFDLAGLKFSLKDGRVKGMKNSIIDKVKWDVKDKKLDVEYHVDSTIKGHYTASGRILILPITGDGQMKLKLKNLIVRLTVNYEMENKQGQDHVKPLSYTVNFDVKDGANFELTNLFNGNKELSDTMLLFLNENWKQITQEFGGPIVEASAKKIFKNLVTFFAKVPIGEIAEV